MAVNEMRSGKNENRNWKLVPTCWRYQNYVEGHLSELRGFSVTSCTDGLGSWFVAPQRSCVRLCSSAMLREIHIQNYAVIENLRVEFEPGLNILSGETGSGKSILIDALSLALGGRASPDVIRTGQERSSITAVFHSARPAWKSWLEEYGIAGSDESELILRRELQSGGRSRLLSRQPVTVAAAKRCTAPRGGSTARSSSFRISAQLDLLDQFAGTEIL
jgi:DNA repair protein RecN (Recombination protein N)